MKPKVFVIIGTILLVVFCGLFFYAINHPTLSLPWTHDTAWIVIFSWLGVTAVIFLTAIVLKVVNVVKSK